MTATAFWIYVCASLLFIIGLIKIFGELPQEYGLDKIMPFGRLFFAIPIVEHTHAKTLRWNPLRNTV